MDNFLNKYLVENENTRRLKIMVSKEGFNWKIAGKKLLINITIVLLSGLLVVWQDDPKYLAFIPIIKLALNWVKHR